MRLNIKKKLYLMILVIFIPALINHSLGIINTFKQSIQVELNNNVEFAQAVNVSFTNFLERLWDTEFSMGIAICKGNLSSQEIEDYMKDIKDSQPTVREYALVNPVTLNIISSTSEKAPGVSLAGRSYINKILDGESKVVSDMINSRVFNEPTFIVARGIREQGKLKGIIIANIDIKDLHLVLPATRATGYSYFGLIDKEGNFIYRNGVSNVASLGINGKDTSFIEPALKGETVKLKKYKSAFDGKDMIGVSMPIEKIGWVTYANTSYKEVVLRNLMNIRDDLIMLFFILAGGIFLSFKIGKQILQPITILHNSALEMSAGNLSARTMISGDDEIALAAKAFDKMADSIEQYDTLKTQFVSNISHELKTPLNVILASLQTLDSKHPANVNCESYTYLQKYMTIMKQNCFRLLRLINNLIDITRIDSGFLKFNFSNHNIVSVVEDITLSVADFSETRGIDITFDTDIEEKEIACDPDMVERIMLNLLSNSIKFTPSGGSIFVNIIDKKDTICIKVKDTGIGIPQEKLAIIFERFRQVDSSMQREYEGSGIGLSLVKALVEAHKGSINVKSECSQGTEVTIELPVALVNEEKLDEKDIIHKQSVDKVQKINIEFSDIYN